MQRHSPRLLFTVTALVMLLGLAGCNNEINHANNGDAVRPVVSGEGVGEVFATPDMVQLNGEVVVQGKTPEEAMQGARNQLDSLITQILQQGIDKKDLQAAQVTVAPQWHYPRDQARQLSGYEARAGFGIKLRDLTRLPALYTVLATAEVAQLQAPVFDFSDREALELQAVQKAVEHAQRKLQAGLQPLGGQLGKLQQLNIDTHWAQPMLKSARGSVMMAADTAAPEAQLNVGEQTITARVQVVFTVAD